MNRHLFTNVNVLDCTGGEPFPGEVLVEGNEISAIASKSTSLERDGGEVHDGEGCMTLMPGLASQCGRQKLEPKQLRSLQFDSRFTK